MKTEVAFASFMQLCILHLCNFMHLWWKPFIYTEKFYSISFKMFTRDSPDHLKSFGVFSHPVPQPNTLAPADEWLLLYFIITLSQKNTAILAVQKWNTAFDVARVFEPTAALKIKTKALAYTENWLGASGANYVWSDTHRAAQAIPKLTAPLYIIWGASMFCGSGQKGL